MGKECKQDVEKLCSTSLPIHNCLWEHRKEIGSACHAVLDPCSIQGHTKSKACETARRYKDTLPANEAQAMERLLQKIDQVAARSGTQYWMAAGSSIGGLLHHSRIPWDDDMDVYVLESDMPKLFKAVGNDIVIHERLEGKVWKAFGHNATPIRNLGWSWPNVDIFPITCNDSLCSEQAVLQRDSKIWMRKDWIFPLVQRPFGRLSLPFPNKHTELVEERYSKNVGSNCVIGGLLHSKERFFASHKASYNCSDLHFYPIFATDPKTTPWLSNPEFTVEHLKDGNDTVLSSVIFDRGNEVRRYYADGLIGVIDSAISFTLPAAPNKKHRLRPVPYLLQERQSYLENFANRSAEELNREVMPMLNRVEVSNKYGASAPRSTLKVVAWNAERGTHYQVFSSFSSNADIVILNEMDWGMARSGNVHTTPLMADQLEMNYAYGVEFMELTNGNAGEINATVGLINDVGYHGNVVLSKWPIVETKVIRLHPLYDHLFKEKSTGQDRGERRLGGRMVLFTLTRMRDDLDLLVISAHGHGGAKRPRLIEDAHHICHEMNQFSSAKIVLLGGDLPGVLVRTLASECETLPLRETNEHNGPRGRPKPTCRVDCSNGGPPRARDLNEETGLWRVGHCRCRIKHSKRYIHISKRRMESTSASVIIPSLNSQQTFCTKINELKITPRFHRIVFAYKHK